MRYTCWFSYAFCKKVRRFLTLFAFVFLCASPSFAADWQQELSQEHMRTPGVYPLSNGQLVAVGKGKFTTQLRADRAERLADILAERDAKVQLAHYLFPQEIAKNPGRQYTVAYSGVHTLFAQGDAKTGFRFLGVLVDPEKVQLIRLSPLAANESYDINVAPLVEELLEADPMLAEGGGGIFPQQGVANSFVAIGVGFAALPESSEDAGKEKEARTLATMEARNALVESIFGSSVNTSYKTTEIILQGTGGDLFREFVENSVQQDIQGFLHNAQVAGEWKTPDGYLAVAVVVGKPRVELGTANAVDKGALPEFNMEEAWEQAFLQRPWLLEGGAAFCMQEGKPYLLVVEKGKLKGDVALDLTQTPLLIETTARSAAGKFLAGVRSAKNVKETEAFFQDENAASFTHTLENLATENTMAVVQGMRKVGSWKNAAQSHLVLAYVIPLPE